MIQFFIPALISFLITAFCLPLVIKIARQFGFVDDPQKRPHPAHVQQRIVPRAGGIAIYLGIVITALLFLPIDKHLVGIIIGLSILLLIGIIDDKIPNFSPYTRLGLLFLAAGTAVLSGIGISFITNPLGFWGTPYLYLDKINIPINFFGTHQIVVIADLLALLWIVTLTQIINWSKGVDGQMPGITLVAALTLGFLSLKFLNQGDINQLGVAQLSFIVAGTSLAFLFFNWYPAKIFPGFSGSTILAFMLAVLSILSGAKFATAILVLGVPSADFIYTFWRRVLSGRSPVWGDRGHLHHRLLDLGWSHQEISLFYILGSAILGLVAVLIDVQSKVFILLGTLTAILLFILWINSFGDLLKQSDPDNG